MNKKDREALLDRMFNFAMIPLIEHAIVDALRSKEGKKTSKRSHSSKRKRPNPIAKKKR